MMKHRVTQDIARRKLNEYPHLGKVLGDDWIAYEYSKPIDEWSLVTGWLSKDGSDPEDSFFAKWLSDLDSALGFLELRVPSNIFSTIRNKIRSHCDRADFKGTSSEIAIWTFLAKQKIPFNLEMQLSLKDTKDVDVSAYPDSKNPIHIEIQWLSESEKAQRGTMIASACGQPYPINFDYECYRIKLKLYDKTSKLTREDITLIALNCTSDPVLGGRRSYCTIAEAAREAFTGQNSSGEPTDYANRKIDKTIRAKVDGVIWFELLPGQDFFPQKRGGCLNSNSSNGNNPSLLEFMKIWME